jgi:hypothetical protein
VRLHKKKAGGGSAPFYYCGDVHFIDWENDRPITIRWQLPEPVPQRLWNEFKIPQG